MKKLALLFSMLLVLALSGGLKAQNYKSAIGLRLGVPLAVSYKFFVTEPGAIELYAGYRHYAFGYTYFSLGGMYEHHFPISSVDGLAWYVGGGASVWFFNYDFVTDESATGIGINGIIGLDYKFANAPINLSVDWGPTFQVSGYGNGFAAGYGALAVRYTLSE
jgi:hypothetical protein